MDKYGVNQNSIGTILHWSETNEIAIPEIQRPFVWKSTKVRDLMDSLYKGYPIGYIITWKNPDVRTKDGTISAGRKVLIDGQQRITALRAAVLGKKIINKEYKEVRIVIAFNPITEEFATLTPAIEKNVVWIPDISEVMSKEAGLLKTVREYLAKNPDIDADQVESAITKLLEIKTKPVGYIELDASLDIDTVTEIFIRINSEGVPLNQSDFAMSKIAAYGEFGVNLRKLIDYFCHLAQEPQFYKHISENDTEFASSDYLHRISWLKDESDDLYDPIYSDVIRVAFMKEFRRAKLTDLVSLLSGRNFELRSFEQQIADESFEKLEKGLLSFVNEYDFKQFVMLIKATGFIVPGLITSKGALNFAYTLYLILRDQKFDSTKLGKMVQKWFVMSMLTNRYTSSSETKMDEDLRNIERLGVEQVLADIEASELSEVFWRTALPQSMVKSGTSNPLINIFFAAQIKARDHGFLSSDILVDHMVQHRGDIHHIFPYDYLKKEGLARSETNQIANFVYAETGINIRIGKKVPRDYFAEILAQVEGGKGKYGSIADKQELLENLEENCIPEIIFDLDVNGYEQFLHERRSLMANKIEHYYANF